jgi:hypothetical protein
MTTCGAEEHDGRSTLAVWAITKLIAMMPKIKMPMLFTA